MEAAAVVAIVEEVVPEVVAIIRRAIMDRGREVGMVGTVGIAMEVMAAITIAMEVVFTSTIITITIRMVRDNKDPVQSASSSSCVLSSPAFSSPYVVPSSEIEMTIATATTSHQALAQEVFIMLLKNIIQ